MTISAEASTIQRRTNATSALTLRYATSSARILLSLIFMTTGLAKLLGMGAMVLLFQTIGLGEELRYAAGLAEIGAALLLITPGGHFPGGLLVGALSLAATVAHLLLIDGNPFPAAGLLTLALFVIWRTRPQRWRRATA
ncbi:hypothetical protein BN1110_05686 [bacterium YEK0313]|nr:hypothetical protein BN1110_05686 [bacterium YEK0313]